MQLFLATILDGNMGVLILAYAIASAENIDNWTWFFKMLQKSINGVGDPSYPIHFILLEKFDNYCT